MAVDAWWWLLLAPLIVITIIVAIVFVLLTVIFNTVRPAMSVSQKKAVNVLVDSISDVAETWQTPRVFIFARILFDLIRYRNYSYIKGVVSNSTDLRQKYANVVQTFKTGGEIDV